MRTLQVAYIKNGKEKTLTAKPETTLDDLMEWQERHIGYPGYESISILKDGVIYTTCEA